MATWTAQHDEPFPLPSNAPSVPAKTTDVFADAANWCRSVHEQTHISITSQHSGSEISTSQALTTSRPNVTQNTSTPAAPVRTRLKLVGEGQLRQELTLERSERNEGVEQNWQALPQAHYVQGLPNMAAAQQHYENQMMGMQQSQGYERCGQVVVSSQGASYNQGHFQNTPRKHKRK